MCQSPVKFRDYRGWESLLPIHFSLYGISSEIKDTGVVEYLMAGSAIPDDQGSGWLELAGL